MRLTVFIGIILSSTLVFAQADFNQLDSNGERHGVWKKMYPGTNQVRYEGTFEHGKEIGVFKFYCETCKAQPAVVKEFNPKNSISEVKFYTVAGKLVSKGMMDDKDRVGEWLFYPERSNEVMTRENYKNGKLEGLKITYYPNGKITEETNYLNGLIDGASNYYSPDGVLLKKLKYKKDLLVGEAFYYDANGNITIQGHYKEGKKNGLWKYYKDGKLILEEIHPKPLTPIKK